MPKALGPGADPGAGGATSPVPDPLAWDRVWVLTHSGEAEKSSRLMQVPDENQRLPLLRSLSTPEANLQGL